MPKTVRRISGLLRWVAVAASAVAGMLPSVPAYAEQSDDDEAVRICERKEWGSKGCRALKASLEELARAKAKADKSATEAAQAKERLAARSRLRELNDQLYSYLVDKGALRPDPEKAKAAYDSRKIGKVAVLIAGEAANFPVGDGTRSLSGFLLSAYKDRIDPKFAHAIP